MGHVATLIVDPAGAATTRTLAYPVERDWPERDRAATRQDFRPLGGGWGRSVASTTTTRPLGVLRLLLSADDRVWLRARMATLLGGATLRVRYVSTDAATYGDVVLAGEEIVERYTRVFDRVDGPWRIDLPVVLMDEAP